MAGGMRAFPVSAAGLTLALSVLLFPSLRNASAAAPAGFTENSDDSRAVLMTLILPDLRVFVDLKPGDMPRNRPDGELSADEVRAAVTLALGNWALVLPGLHFRLVASPDSANLVMRFRDYGGHIPGGSTAVSFLPGQWRPPKPAPGGFDFACGAEQFGKLPSGGTCAETANNIILFQTRDVAFRRVDFLDARMHHAYLAAKADRADPRKRFFRFLPDARYQAWPPDRSTCVTGAPRGIPGAPRGAAYPAWDVQCLADSDWAALPHFDRFGPVEGPYDLAGMAQHEFGHAILGGHTCESGACLFLTGGAYQDFGRDTVYRMGEAIRLAHWHSGAGSVRSDGAVAHPSAADSGSYSLMFTGNGLDAAWNSRGIFEIDGRRLASGALDWNCAPVGPWKGYLTSYPRTGGWIVLKNAAGETKYVDDWRYAQRLMAWPLGHGRPVSAGWFQTGVILGQGPK